MKLTLQLRILPTEEQIRSLETTMIAFNEAANWLAGHAHGLRTANKIRLQKLHYQGLRERFRLSAQMAVRCIAQVCEAYKRDKSKRPTFRKFASVPYDQRIMSFKGPDRVSLLTLDGRILVPFIVGRYQRERFTPVRGQSDLVRRSDGKWFLLVTVEVPEATEIPVTDFIGVDLGVVNLATDSDGHGTSGAYVEQTRIRYHTRRRRLQKEAHRQAETDRRPKNVRRALKRNRKKEANFRRNTNHVLSKQIVAKAKDTGQGIALEDLTGIRDRTRFRERQRSRMSGWAFGQLRLFIEYKARLVGVPIVLVDPRDTSRMCSVCGYTDRRNRPSQEEFKCCSCGHIDHADRNAARNIRVRAIVNWPMVSELSHDLHAA